MRVAEIIADFDTVLTQAYRPASASAYRTDLHLWREFLAEQGIDHIESVQAEHLRHFIRLARA
ncbi:site-specific integrase, partial [Acidithiobacillus caldus]|uniref:site-specific integrase n=1 Tax=Acidithiobacillus caldus TaxID=33059 RepID=UPI001C06BC37|nr:site-specific integrase [Acidithiobacillus caldus]